MGKKYTVPMAYTDFFQKLLSKWAIYKAIREKSLPCVHIGRRILLDEDALQAWWREQEAKSIRNEESQQDQCGKLRRVQ